MSVDYVWREDLKRRGYALCPKEACSMAYLSLEGIRKHYMKCNGKALEGDYVTCPTCHIRLKQLFYLRQHQLKSHTGNLSDKVDGWFAKHSNDQKPVAGLTRYTPNAPNTSLTVKEGREKKPVLSAHSRYRSSLQLTGIQPVSKIVGQPSHINPIAGQGPSIRLEQAPSEGKPFPEFIKAKKSDGSIVLLRSKPMCQSSPKTMPTRLIPVVTTRTFGSSNLASDISLDSVHNRVTYSASNPIQTYPKDQDFPTPCTISTSSPLQTPSAAAAGPSSAVITAQTDFQSSPHRYQSPAVGRFLPSSSTPKHSSLLSSLSHRSADSSTQRMPDVSENKLQSKMKPLSGYMGNTSNPVKYVPASELDDKSWLEEHKAKLPLRNPEMTGFGKRESPISLREKSLMEKEAKIVELEKLARDKALKAEQIRERRLREKEEELARREEDAIKKIEQYNKILGNGSDVCLESGESELSDMTKFYEDSSTQNISEQVTLTREELEDMSPSARPLNAVIIEKSLSSPEDSCASSETLGLSVNTSFGEVNVSQDSAKFCLPRSAGQLSNFSLDERSRIGPNARNGLRISSEEKKTEIFHPREYYVDSKKLLRIENSLESSLDCSRSATVKQEGKPAQSNDSTGPAPAHSTWAYQDIPIDLTKSSLDLSNSARVAHSNSNLPSPAAFQKGTTLLNHRLSASRQENDIPSCLDLSVPRSGRNQDGAELNENTSLATVNSSNNSQLNIKTSQVQKVRQGVTEDKSAVVAKVSHTTHCSSNPSADEDSASRVQTQPVISDSTDIPLRNPGFVNQPVDLTKSKHMDGAPISQIQKGNIAKDNSSDSSANMKESIVMVPSSQFIEDSLVLHFPDLDERLEDILDSSEGKMLLFSVSPDGKYSKVADDESVVNQSVEQSVNLEPSIIELTPKNSEDTGSAIQPVVEVPEIKDTTEKLSTALPVDDNKMIQDTLNSIDSEKDINVDDIVDLIESGDLKHVEDKDDINKENEICTEQKVLKRKRTITLIDSNAEELSNEVNSSIKNIEDSNKTFDGDDDDTIERDNEQPRTPSRSSEEVDSENNHDSGKSVKARKKFKLKKNKKPTKMEIKTRQTKRKSLTRVTEMLVEASSSSRRSSRIRDKIASKQAVKLTSTPYQRKKQKKETVDDSAKTVETPKVGRPKKIKKNETKEAAKCSAKEGIQDEEHDLEEEDELNSSLNEIMDLELTPDSKHRRAAARNAEMTIKKIHREDSSAENSDVSLQFSDDSEDNYDLSKDISSKKMYKLVSTSYGEREYKCLVCLERFISKDKIDLHFIKEHEGELFSKQQDVDSEEEFIERDDRSKTKKYGGQQYTSPKLDPDPKFIEREASFREQCFSQDWLSWWEEAESDVGCLTDEDDYLPPLSTSWTFSVGSARLDAVEHRVKRFQSRRFGGSSCVGFCGGPIWAMAWAPQPRVNKLQYLAISTHLSEKETPYGSTANVFDDRKDEENPQPGLIQIWDFELDSKQSLVEDPSMLIGIAHSYGKVWDLAWCPSGLWQDDACIGGMAAACSDGTVRIFHVRFPEKKGGLVRYKVHRTLIPSKSFQGHCLSVSWYRGPNHRYIAGSFVSGLVAIWDLSTESSLLQTNQGLLPVHAWIAHCSSVTAISFSSSVEEFPPHCVTGGSDRSYRFWDLRDTCSPIQEVKRGLVTSVTWLPGQPAAAVSHDDVYLQAHTQTLITESGYLRSGSQPIIGQNSCVWGQSISPWLGGLAVCTSAGELIVYMLSDLNKSVDFNKSNVRRKNYVYITRSGSDTADVDTNQNADKIFYHELWDQTDLSNEAKELSARVRCSEKMEAENLLDYPLLSLNRVSWNPNLGSQCLLASGGQAGMFRLHVLSSLNTVKVLDACQNVQKTCTRL